MLFLPPLPLLPTTPMQRGNAVMRAVWDDMVSRGLGKAPDSIALFGGASAGGRGALFNCDAMRSRVIGELTKVRGSPIQYPCVLRLRLCVSFSLHLQAGLSSNLAQFSCFPDSAMWLDLQVRASLTLRCGWTSRCGRGWQMCVLL